MTDNIDVWNHALELLAAGEYERGFEEFTAS
jgi:hypothetical protein